MKRIEDYTQEELLGILGEDVIYEGKRAKIIAIRKEIKPDQFGIEIMFQNQDGHSGLVIREKHRYFHLCENYPSPEEKVRKCFFIKQGEIVLIKQMKKKKWKGEDK